MFGRDRTTTGTRVVAYDARGGISPGAILTGVLVAFGATFILSAIVGGVLVALGINDTPSNVVTLGVGTGIALIIAMFLAYLWGGYAAGRMARGAGLANGLLVPLAAIVVALIVGGIVTALGATANLNLPSLSHFNPGLPVTSNELKGKALDASLWMGLGALIAMFLGGAIGGLMGARWHTKLERHTLEEREADVDEGTAVTTTPATVQSTRTVEVDRTTPTADPYVTDRTATSDGTSDDAAAVSASSAPPTTGGAVRDSSEYPRANPTVTGDTSGIQEESSTTETTTETTSGDTRA
jgi:hypothetical protein